MNVVIVTDAWKPQVNGVVRTYEQFGRELTAMGHTVSYITPDGFRTVPMPGYPEIRLALFPYRGVAKTLRAKGPDAIHIGTEGPLGSAARRYCRRNGIPFTTAYHTRFPEYLRLRLPVPLGMSYAWLRRFHRPAVRTMVPTDTQKRYLEERGFDNLVVCGRGVDTDLFRPLDPARDDAPYDLPRPVHLYLGRVAVEKNIGAFLDLDLPGSKVVVGDGPDLAALRRRNPGVLFAGFRFGEDLARHLAAADLFVFPSRTDTFGIVLLEAMACGLPVAAYPVDGPRDVVQQGVTGWLDDDLAVAVEKARTLDPANCLRFARQHTWRAVTEVFQGILAPIPRQPATGLQRAA